MCGLYGTFGFHDHALMKKLDASLAHRGPDDAGNYTGDGVWLGHRRLSIIDIGGSAQPIHNEDQSVWLVYNGEIYNYLTLRDKLEQAGHIFYTKGDAEVLVHLYEEHGLDGFKQLDGIFSFAIWDQKKAALFLVRDRMGIKPLYYFVDGPKFIFSSEMRSLLLYDGIDKTLLSKDKIMEYMAYRHTPGPECIIQGVRKVMPGEVVSVTNSGVTAKNLISRSSEDVKPIEQPVVELRDRLRRSVHSQLISDVPVGILLSGGIDSVSITALAAEMQSGIHTFTAEFENDPNTELQAAKNVAREFKTDHTELTIRGTDLTVVPKAIAANDEPVAGPSSFAYYMMLDRVKEAGVKVVLLGHGADEVAGGYEHLDILTKISKYSSSPIVGPLGEFALDTMRRLAPQDQCFARMKRLWLAQHRHNESYIRLYGVFDQFSMKNLFRDTSSTASNLSPLGPIQPGQELGDAIMSYEMGPWLSDDLLLRVDRTCMSHSIEGRVPFLSNEMVDFACRVSYREKRRGGKDKALLRQAMKGIVPDTVLSSRKQRFTAPIDRFFGDRFISICRTLFTEKSVLNEVLFDNEFLLGLLEYHRAPSYRFGLRFHPLFAQFYARQIWTVFTFYIWYKSVIEGVDCTPYFE